MAERPIPSSLRRLALTWAVLAALAVCGITVNVDLGWGPWPMCALGLAFAPALLAGWPLARVILLVFTWVGFAVAGLFFLTGLGADGFKAWTFMGVAVVMTLLLLEQRWVLNRPDVRRYFKPHGSVG